MNTRSYPVVGNVTLRSVFALGVMLTAGCVEDPAAPNNPDAQHVVSPSLALRATQGPHTLSASGTYASETRFTITNNSSNGVGITGVIIDLTTANADAFFDPVAGNPGADFNVPFLTRDGFVAGLTGWIGDILGSADVTDPYYTVLGLNRVEDGALYLHMSFDGFMPGQTFRFSIDVDRRVRGRYSSLCLASCFSGSGVTVVFGGPSVNTTPVRATYRRTNWRVASF